MPPCVPGTISTFRQKMDAVLSAITSTNLVFSPLSLSFPPIEPQNCLEFQIWRKSSLEGAAGFSLRSFLQGNVENGGKRSWTVFQVWLLVKDILCRDYKMHCLWKFYYLENWKANVLRKGLIRKMSVRIGLIDSILRIKWGLKMSFEKTYYRNIFRRGKLECTLESRYVFSSLIVAQLTCLRSVYLQSSSRNITCSEWFINLLRKRKHGKRDNNECLKITVV